MSLKVIGAGFGRTGTLSMKAALERLGYEKCHHMLEIITSSQQSAHWASIAEGDSPDWDKVFDGFQACVDFPACVYYQELLQHYPDAKVVLTVRSTESWYKSSSDTIFKLSNVAPKWLTVVPHFKNMHSLTQKIVWQGTFDDRFADKAHAISVFNQHIENVKKVVPADKLLIMQVADGWAPLCEFLGKDIPDEPFPHVNDTAEFTQRIRIMQAIAALPWIVGGLALLGAIIALSS